ncbi:MAG: hypothetical protein ACAI43_09305 [Phycisphaerae bacterium]|nr:hypothetical protein [Tepidisphaeraceae bacterium]
MFDEPQEDPSERAIDPATKAKDKSDEFRMHAELFAVFEGPRKFDAELKPLTDADLAREVQRTMGKLEKAKSPESPVLPEPVTADAAALLALCDARGLSTNDYHVHRRPGEVMITRWLKGDEVETYYTRLQAHFDAAMGGFKEDERQALEWKKDPDTAKYLEALEAVDVKMAERYLRDPIKQLGLFVLSTQAADELNIAYLADYVMSVTPAEIVGRASAPPDEAPTERDLAWFFKLFSLRGMVDGVERMCFFAYLQKADDEGW